MDFTDYNIIQDEKLGILLGEVSAIVFDLELVELRRMDVGLSWEILNPRQVRINFKKTDLKYVYVLVSIHEIKNKLSFSSNMYCDLIVGSNKQYSGTGAIDIETTTSNKLTILKINLYLPLFEFASMGWKKSLSQGTLRYISPWKLRMRSLWKKIASVISIPGQKKNLKGDSI